MAIIVFILQVMLGGYISLIAPSKTLVHLANRPKVSPVKAIYMTAYTAGDSRRFTELRELVNRTELNAMVIDLKDYSGRIFIRSKSTDAAENGSFEPRIGDIRGLISVLKNDGIYIIARIAVFQDPYLAEKRHDLAVKDKSGGLWRDFKGLAWVDASLLEVWDYNLSVAYSAVSMGFDEINFDYVRFPSDGKVGEMVFSFEDSGKTKNQVLAEFFRYVDQKMRYLPVRTSVDLFGMTLWRDDGLGIGQRFQDADGRFDYIYPMVYPSHYPDNFEGFDNPAEYPYEIVYNSLDKGKYILSSKRTKIRPWIQDFDLGSVYDSSKVMLQISAANKAGSDGFLLWNSSNRYTEEALSVEINQ